MASSRRSSSSIKNHDGTISSSRAKYSVSMTTLFLVIVTTIISSSTLANAVPTSYTLSVTSGFPLSIPTQVSCRAGPGPFIADRLLQSGETLTFSFGIDHDLGVPIGGVICRFSSSFVQVDVPLFDYDREVGGARCAANTCVWAANTRGIFEYFNNQWTLIFHWP